MPQAPEFRLALHLAERPAMESVWAKQGFPQSISVRVLLGILHLPGSAKKPILELEETQSAT